MSVVGAQLQISVPYQDGRTFGSTGPATLTRLKVEHAVDPLHPANRCIVDLDLAERDRAGLVHFDHDVIIVQPADPSARNGWALVDISNRGGPTASSFLQLDDTPFFPQPEQPPAGDGHLLAEGWTIVYTGWQFDIAAPTLLGLRAPTARVDDQEISGQVSYRLRAFMAGERLPLGFPGQRVWPAIPDTASLFEDDVELPGESWSFSDDGTAIIRPDGFNPGSWYRCDYETSGALVGGCGLLALRDLAPWLRAEHAIRRTMLFGVSQSGRALRQFLHDGLNADPAGQPVYDAFMPLIAGGRRGQFNQRFAIPGTLPSSPDELDPDPTYGALLARAGASAKVMAVNTSNEYWRGDAAGVGTDTHSDVRVHHIAGTQHAPGYLPLLFELPALGWKAQHGFNIVDYRPVLRALLQQLLDWVDHDAEPEPSTAPQGEQLSTRQAVLAHYQRAGIATPRLESFVQPPGPVPTIGADGNETSGIQTPDTAAPVGVHTGWNLRHPDIGAPTDELLLVGSTWWLNDLPTLQDHLTRTKTAIDALVQHRFLLPQDVGLVTARAETAWRTATESS